MNKIMFHLIHQPLFQNAEHAFRDCYYYKEGNFRGKTVIILFVSKMCLWQIQTKKKKLLINK